MAQKPNHPSGQVFARLPGWARNPPPLTPAGACPVLRHGAVGGPAEAAFAAGAALAILDPRARAETEAGSERLAAQGEGPEKGRGVRAPARVPAGAWRCRLALTAAAASTKIMRRGEDEAALRDAFCLRHGSADPGPAGRMLMAWRHLDRSAPLDEEAVLHAAELFGLRVDGALKAAIAEAQSIAASKDVPNGAPLAAAQAASLVMTQRPDAEILSLWLADAVLATRLKWPRPLPLLATAVFDRALRSESRPRRPHPLDDDWPTPCCAAYAIAAVKACALFDDLQQRSQKLLGARLRAKGAAAVVEKLHEEDAVAGSQPMEKISARALRRLFDRLVALGAVRELTGRASFRLYGL
jgi:Protein of unknown function (DUF1403)